MEELKELVAMVQESVDKGTTTFETLHRKSASFSRKYCLFSYMAPGLVEKVWQWQDQRISDACSTIRKTNARAGSLAMDLLARHVAKRSRH